MAGAAPTLAALRRAETAAAASSAMEQAVDRLIACESLSESQHLVLALQDCAKNHHSSPFTESLYVKLQQAAAICSEPSGKAQYLGFVLLQAGVHLLETLDVSTQRQVLLKVFSANNGVLSGYVAALTASDGPFFSYQMDYRRVTMTLETISPVLKSVLMDTNQSEGHKASVLDALSRIAWHFGGHSEDHEALRTAVARVLVQALELVPHSQLSRATYAVHVALAVDLLSSRTTQSKEQVALAKRAAKFVLESTQILMGEGEGVLALLQSLEQLAQVVPEALWCSEFLTSTAYFFLDKCETPMEQRLLLRVLTHTLEFGRDVASDDRSVYVEILLLPLSSMISLHGSAVSELLKLVMEIKSASEYRPHMEIEKDPTPTETATHARSAVRLISDERECQRWLSSLFQSQEPESPDSKNNSTDKWLALLLVALLSDERSTLRLCAANCLERQVSSSLKFWGADSTKVLVASLVFLVSQHPSGNAKTTSGRAFGEWVTSCLYSLAALAATTTDTMRIVLRLIDSMNEATKMRPMALKLMYEVWRNESRVFPRLETMLLEATDPDNDVERHVVNMATIKTLCEKDPELGVQFISSIQGFLEDELESVVSMAMDGITALCGGDCLDFYFAFKIIAQKLRKNKVTCADEPLFQERLCCFYALGGAESAANEKHASKLLDQAWGFADSEHPNVRKAAYAAMCQFPLDMLGLCMPVADSAGQDSDDDDQMTEEEIEEQLDDLMQRLHNEHDPTVRAEIENLVAKVIEHESTKLTAGVGRGQRMASAASGQQQSSQHTGSVVSAAATKEMKALLPSRAEVQGMFSTTPVTADWSGFLLTYQPKSVIDAKNVKRKDKLVRLATHNVDELVETVSSVLQAMELPWASPGVSSDALLRIQALMEGWRGFMATFASSLDELAELKTPVGVDDADVAFRVFSEGVADLLNSLLNDNPNKIGGALAAGALAGQLCESRHWQNPQLRAKYEETVTELSRRLALTIEQARVFSGDASEARVSSIGFLIALQLSFGRRKVDASEDCKSFCIQLEKVEEIFMELYRNASDQLLGTCTLLGMSHIAALFMNGDELEAYEVNQWRQQRVKPIAELLLVSFLLPDQTRQATSSSSSGDMVFPLNKTIGADTSIEKVSADYDQDGSGDGILLRWASLLGLARLCSGFSSIKRLDWLTNVQQVLAAVWEVGNSSSIIAVALGPVLLECVHFSLAPSSSLEGFVASCIERAATFAADGLDKGLLMMAAAHVLCHFESFGGFPGTIQNQTKLVVEQIQETLEDESQQDHAMCAFMVSGIANFFHLAFGISGEFISAKQKTDGNVELTLDSNTIGTLVKLARAEAERKSIYSSAVLGAIARAADGFYVSQKKKSFDVEIRSVPTNTMLSKTLEWLRQTNPSGNSSNTETIADTRIAESLLACLTSTGSVLPLLDYSSFTHRVMLRFCSDGTSVACIRFAATQGSCDELLTTELLSSRWFANADTAVQAELIASLSLAATRLPTDVLRTLLINLFDILKDVWRRDTSSSNSTVLFDSWTDMLREVLTSTRRIPDTSLDMVNQVIREKMVVELPFGLQASLFVEQFATHVLSKVNYSECGIADTFLMPSASNSSMWSWWRNGVFVVELAKLGVLTISKREASLAFQSILRHDFEEWTDDSLVGNYLQPLMARIGALIAQHTRPGENVSSLLDVIDAFSRGMSSLDFSTRADSFKRRAQFDVMACVLSWNRSLSHEKYLMTIPRAEIANMDTASDLLPFGLISSGHNAKTVSAVGERLLALQQQLNNVTADEAREYSAALHVCSRQMYVAADSCHIPNTMSGDIREFWSLDNSN
ncbi:hypothetical protein PF005_g13831 [Phytophthora fragariae]|uniref:DUF3730 domain-containing protein n=1 Tax=Phytophthora fragariae TaxID=53985 RepID=A0A6A3ZCJ5_9STRA|nr:hypothetical protein PF003_g39560 [Phytophthora fragariae]KAE8934845.1 hypothetical protein PF009_g15192 [Phytophthora fragariae]KAE9104113.1 hypothetical protein PF007_g14170 [Phytophthora fragariae]KAE9141810.1 hypothetical protein PF006_g13032 [Phytophthora fragariae]KAE9204338.1 hypothetical protein PF005_g13831 [Phytophthora fragariae]